MRVLLIEDDSATAQSIELMLKSENFNVYITDLGEEGVDLGKLYDYDIILLDLNLPDMSGYDVLKQLRVSKIKTPILILSGLAGIEDKVKGLGVGADDYMTKPFSPRELVARVRAVLRRGARAAEPRDRIETGDLVLDVPRLRVSAAGRPVDLTATEFAILAAMAREPGRVFTRSQLLDAVHGVAFEAYERAIDAHVKNIRRKLERDPGRPRYVQTVYGVGYRVAEAPNGTEVPDPDAPGGGEG
jgi:two-component system cell cycle response regulator CtrA